MCWKDDNIKILPPPKKKILQEADRLEVGWFCWNITLFNSYKPFRPLVAELINEKGQNVKLKR